MTGIMAEIVEVDNAGRIVLPKRLREEMGIKGRTRLVLTQRGNKVIMMRLDVDEIARKLEEELSEIDVEKVAESVRREINAKITKEHPELTAR
jgi:AbrB family looped-hinge helix DNA binding protein